MGHIWDIGHIRDRRRLRDARVHEGLRERGLVDLIVPVASVAYVYMRIYMYIRVYIYTHCARSVSTLPCQKRPITVSKETYYSVKRDLVQCQKRPSTVSKET